MAIADGREIVDADGDGYDDRTGQPGSSGRTRAVERQAQEAAQRAYDEATEYWESGEGQRDIDAGRRPRYPRDPDQAAREAASARRAEMESAARRAGGGSGGGSDPSDGRPDWLREMDAATGDIPFVGGILGSAARNAATAEERRRVESMGLWGGLLGGAPSPDDLAVDYGEEGFIGGPDSSELAGAQADAGSIEAQRQALQQLQGLSEGRLTDADRRRMQLAQMEIGRGMRSQREADAAALQSRGLGGSGAEIASMIGAGQAGADALFARDTEAQVEAQRRGLQALQGAASLSSGMRGQSFEEDATRRGAADDFLRWQTDYQRGREQRNTERRGRTAESRSSARQQAYENRERAVAGMTGQYSSDAQARSRERAEQRQGEQQTLATAGSLFEELFD